MAESMAGRLVSSNASALTSQYRPHREEIMPATRHTPLPLTMIRRLFLISIVTDLRDLPFYPCDKISDFPAEFRLTASPDVWWIKI